MNKLLDSFILPTILFTVVFILCTYGYIHDGMQNEHVYLPILLISFILYCIVYIFYKKWKKNP